MPPASSCSFRQAVEADLPILVALRAATMTPHFERQGIAIDAEEHRRRAEFRLDAAAIVECEGQDVGMIKVLRDGTTWTIEQFQLTPAHQGKGLGAAVLRAVIADARASGAQLRLILVCVQ